MPIGIERFEQESAFEAGETHAEQILGFLAANDDWAFRRSEIGEAIDVDPNVVNSVLTRLKERDLVRHKQPYWAIGDAKRLCDVTAFSRSMRSLDERLGSEDLDEWRASAVDDSAGNEEESRTRDAENRK